MEKKFDSIILRKMKNNKGFTLIELLAVIVVLAIILIIAVPAIGNIIENSRRQAYLNDEKMMEKAAKTYVMKYPTTLPKEVGSKTNVLLSDMIKANVIENIKDPKDKSNNCDGYVEIEKVGDKKYNYKAYLQCGDNYATEGIVDGIIVTVPKVTDSNPGVLSGSGSSSDPYLIESIEDLVAFGQAVDEGNTYSGKYIRLEVDLDFNNINSYGDPDENYKQELKTSLTTGRGFNGIGEFDFDSSLRDSFSGTFDGNNKVIKNLFMDNSTDSYGGLFSSVENGTVKNLGVINANIHATTHAGVLGTMFTDSTISNTYSTGNIQIVFSENTLESAVGGLVAITYNTTCVNSYSTVDIKAYDESLVGVTHAGGLLGVLFEGSVVTNSYATGNIEGVTSGGLIGAAGDNGSAVYNSYATGDVTGMIYVGGLVGYIMDVTINNSYALGSVTGISFVGGLTGVMYDSSVINKSYATGLVTGTIDVGGLVGRTESDEEDGYPAINNSYTTGNVRGVSYSGNDFLEATSPLNVGPFIGNSSDGTILNNSYRYNNLTCTSCDNTLGTAVTAANLGSSDWHRNTLGWNSQWSLTNGKYPLLYKKDTTTLLERQKLINTP